jgi:hypothetical protein
MTYRYSLIMDDSFEDTEWDMFVGGLLRFHNMCLQFSSSLLNLCCTTKFPHLINLDKYLLLKNRKYTKFFQCWHFTRLHICVNFPLSQALNYELKTPRWAHANLKWVDPVHNQLTFRGKYIYVWCFLRWPWGLGGVAEHGLSPVGGFLFFV